MPWDILLALAAVYLIWGSTYLAIRIALVSFPPFLMTGARFVLASAVLFTLALGRRWRWPSRRQWVHGGLVGTLMLGGGVGGTAFAEQWVASGLAAVAVASIPLWTVLFAALWRVWPTRRELLSLMIGFSGVVLLNLEGNLRANPVGAVAILLATACWSLGSVWSRRLDIPAGGMGYAVEMLVGGVAVGLLGWARGETVAATITPAAVVAWLYLVTFGSLVAFSAYMLLLQRTRLAVATSYAYVNPIIAVFLGLGLAGEPISGLGLGAMVIILASVLLLARR